MTENSQEFSMDDNVAEARSAVAEYELPTGYLDKTGELHKDVSFQEMTGEEEDILGSRKMDVTNKISKILENCIVSIGAYNHQRTDWSKIVQELSESDRMYCLLKIRIISLGESLSFKSECPKCEKQSSQVVSLEEIKVVGLKDPYKRSWSGILPRSKKEFMCTVLTSAKKVDTDSDLISSFILSRLSLLDGKAATMETVKKLPLLDRNYLRGQIKEFEGEVDSEIEIQCPFCKEEYKTDLDIGTPDFFFPSAI